MESTYHDQAVRGQEMMDPRAMMMDPRMGGMNGMSPGRMNPMSPRNGMY